MGKSTQIITILCYNKYGSDKLKQRSTFYKKFSLEEGNIIKEYFTNLNNNISLTKKETIKMITAKIEINFFIRNSIKKELVYCFFSFDKKLYN